MRFSFVTRLVLITLGFVTTLIVARQYGPIATGQIGLAAAILNVTAVLSMGGAELMALKRLSGKEADRNEVFTASFWRIGLGILIVGAGFYALYLLDFFSLVAQSLGETFVIFLPGFIAINAFRLYCYETIRSFEATITYNLLLIASPLSFLCMVMFYPALPLPVSFAWLVAFSELICIFLAGFVFFQYSNGLRLIKLAPSQITNQIRRMTPYFISTLSVAAYQLDILIVGLILPAEELGAYVVASRLATFVGLPMVAAAIGFAPRVAQLFRNKGKAATIVAGKDQTRMLAPITFAGGFLMLFSGQLILGFFGLEFKSAYSVLIPLVLAQMVLASAGHAGLLLVMSNQQRQQARIFFLSALVIVLGSIVLVPKIGALGASIAVLAGAVVRAGWGSAVIARTFGDGISIIHVFCRHPMPSHGKK